MCRPALDRVLIGQRHEILGQVSVQVLSALKGRAVIARGKDPRAPRASPQPRVHDFRRDLEPARIGSPLMAIGGARSLETSGEAFEAVKLRSDEVAETDDV